MEPHLEALRALGHAPIAVRKVEQLSGVTHLILPGGESTTLEKLLRRFGVWEPLRALGHSQEVAFFGTCAGAILLGRESAERPPRMQVVDVEVTRNAYGSQLDSFTAPVTLTEPLLEAGTREIPGVFIRAPRFGAYGAGIEVLGTQGGEPVLLRGGRHLLATFHPELTEDRQLHRYFLEL